MKATFYFELWKDENMKTFLKIFLFPLLIICLIQCSSTESELNYSTGTVKYIALEGGFYGINSDKGENFDPLNLPKEYQVDGKRISFSYKVRDDLASFHMWGVIIEIIEIQELK